MSAAGESYVAIDISAVQVTVCMLYNTGHRQHVHTFNKDRAVDNLLLLNIADQMCYESWYWL